MADNSGSIKSILLALVANFAIAVAKYVVAFISGSGSMMAEAVHSTADCANQALLLLGIKKAKRPPGPEYPLGYGKEIFFWSFIVAILLFSVGGLFSLYEGFHKLHSDEILKSPALAIAVLIFAIIAESISLVGCIKEINKIKGDKTLYKWFVSSRRSELVVVFGEDIAALLGLCFALVAIIITVITNNPIYDALGSIVIGLLLIVIAVVLGIKIKGLLIGQGVEVEKRKEYQDFLSSFEGIEEVYNMITLQNGSDVVVAVKVKMKHQDSASMINAINRAEISLKQKFPEIMWSFFEPDNSN